MSDNNNHPPGLKALVTRIAGTGLDILRNRGELLSVEWQEEKARHAELLVLAVGTLLLGFLGTALLTALIIFLCPIDWRLWVAGAFVGLYFLGAYLAFRRLKALLARAPFDESLNQLRKDKDWLSTLK